MSALVIKELLLGLVRLFPNTMTGITLLGGLALGQLSWVLMSIGALIIALIITAIHLFGGSITTYFPRTIDAAILNACSVIPTTAPGATYWYLPSLWITLTVYYLTYILFNAVSVYTAPSTKLPAEAMPVQHRKSIGVVSIIAIVLLLVSLLFHRAMTGCEYTLYLGPVALPVGILLSTAIGVGWAYAWYTSTRAMGASLFYDVHGVMMGLQPGGLRTSPLACAPQPA